MIGYLRFLDHSISLIHLTLERANSIKDETPSFPPWVLQADNRLLEEKCVLINKFLSAVYREFWRVLIPDLLSLAKWIVEVFKIDIRLEVFNLVVNDSLDQSAVTGFRDVFNEFFEGSP